jgi:hypothetical protein
MEKNSNSSPDNVVQVDFKGRASVSSPASHRQAALELAQKKRELFDAWLKLGTVCVLFDARIPGVKVPPDLQGRGDLRLNFCYNFHIADFNFNDAAVFATLSFDNGEFFCSVPWHSIYGIQSASLNQGAVWFDSFPPDLDQVSTLGFSEEMCEEWSEAVLEEDQAPLETNNVIELDFSAK